jgi:hypothetical protein
MALKPVGVHQVSLQETIVELQAKVTSLATLANELKSDMSAHTHTENTASTYAQNATTGAAPTISADAVTV